MSSSLLVFTGKWVQASKGGTQKMMFGFFFPPVVDYFLLGGWGEIQFILLTVRQKKLCSLEGEGERSSGTLSLISCKNSLISLPSYPAVVSPSKQKSQATNLHIKELGEGLILQKHGMHKGT